MTVHASDAQDIADAVVAKTVAGHLHPRAMARALARAAITIIATLEGDQAAADVCFSRFSRHNSRASREPLRAGTKR